MLDLIYKFASDLVLAEDLLGEEVLRFSTHPERFCAVCKLVIPSLEASWKPENCDHVICIACFWQYAPETEPTGLPRCAVASCESLCKSETHQGINVDHSTLILTEDKDSGKGKEPLDVTLQELGQCSSGANAMTSSDEFYCTICMETVHIREVFPVPGCTHLFCMSCLSQYITTKVEDNVLSISCPEPECNDGTLNPEACQDVIPLQLFHRWGSALCDLALGAFKLYCPFKDCSALLVNERGPRDAAIRKAGCPYCSRMFCAECKVPWHYEATCEDFQRLGNDELRLDDQLREGTQESMARSGPVGSCESFHKSEIHQGINVDRTTLISIESMDNNKGEKPFDAMLQELGQCSSSANVLSDNEFYCTICMETLHIRDLFPISGCTHLFCVSCMNQYITAKVDDTALPIGCPEPGCKDGLLDPDACRDMIPLELFQRWGTAFCDLAVRAFKLCCPFKDCSALLVDECGSWDAAIKKAECPYCSRMFCAQCKVAWHYGVTCEDFQQLGNDEQVRDDLQLRKVAQLGNDVQARDDLLLRKVVQESKWQRCFKRVVATCQSFCKSKPHRGIVLDHSTLISTEGMDSRKGKDPLYDMLQDLGQCSPDSDTIASYEFYCTICMETVHVRELFLISGCTHLFCVSCVSQYIAAKVEDNVLSIGCPDPGCKGALDPEACRAVIPPQVFQRWGDALCDSALGSFKFYCPFNDCSALLVDERARGGEAVITNAECPHCRRMFCAQCKVAWHDGITCVEFQRLGKDERSRNDNLLRKVARESRWQRCPKCKMYVERTQGCVYIVCRCRHRFCYLCASPMSKGIHHCSKCRRTW